MNHTEYIDTEHEALRLNAAHDVIHFSSNVHEIFSALVKAQTQMGAAHKGAENPFFRSHYADLSEVLRVCKDALNENGIAILQPISTGSKGVIVTTLFTHTSGEWMSSSVDFPVGKLDSQEYGKAVSYARRYSLLSFLSIPTEDDDGETSRKQNPTQPSFTPLAPQPAGPLQEITANREKKEPVTRPKTQTMVLEPSPVQEVSMADEGEIDFYAFAVNEDRIGQVTSVEEKTSRDGTKTWWVISLASKDQDFTAKAWDPASIYQLENYAGLIGQSVWYRVSEKEYRGAMQYTLHYIGLVDPE